MNSGSGNASTARRPRRSRREGAGPRRGRDGWLGQHGSMALAERRSRHARSPSTPPLRSRRWRRPPRSGELFQYTVGSVTLPRQRSAMIPIVTDDVEIEKAQHLQRRRPAAQPAQRRPREEHHRQAPAGRAGHGPRRPARYAGDARIDDLPPGQERLLSYGIDLQMLVDSTQNTRPTPVQTGKIVKGVLTSPASTSSARTTSPRTKAITTRRSSSSTRCDQAGRWSSRQKPTRPPTSSIDSRERSPRARPAS